MNVGLASETAPSKCSAHAVCTNLAMHETPQVHLCGSTVTHVFQAQTWCVWETKQMLVCVPADMVADCLLAVLNDSI